MNKIVSYKIFPELKLIIEVVGGSISIDDFIELKRNEILDKNYNPNYNFIVSVNYLEPSFEDEQLKKIIDYIKDNRAIIGKRRSAILTETPKQTVASIMYESATKGLPMSFKTVSTIKAAMDWVGVSFEHESFILKNIELMKNSST
jgi:hypothetical protein